MGTSLEYDGLQTTSIEETWQPSQTAVTGILKLVSAHPKQVSKTDEGSIESTSMDATLLQHVDTPNTGIISLHGAS